jgi:hypothetical protein
MTKQKINKVWQEVIKMGLICIHRQHENKCLNTVFFSDARWHGLPCSEHGQDARATLDFLHLAGYNSQPMGRTFRIIAVYVKNNTAKQKISS